MRLLGLLRLPHELPKRTRPERSSLPCSCQDVSGLDLFPKILGACGENPPPVWRKKCAQEMLQKTLWGMTLHGCTTSLLVLPCNRHPQLLRRSGNLGPRRLNLQEMRIKHINFFQVSIVFQWQFLTRWSRCRPKQLRKKEQKHHMYHPNMFEIHPTPLMSLAKKELLYTSI